MEISLFLVTVCILFLGCHAKGDGVVDETYEADQGTCYSCSGKTSLCRESVYDAQHLSRAPCDTKCFLRIEGNEIYRGCFDGWVGGMVKSNYEGCRIQKYLGQEVEWCFCSGKGGKNLAPCNGKSRGELGSTMKLPSPYEKFGGGLASIQYVKTGFPNVRPQYVGYNAGKVATYDVSGGLKITNGLTKDVKPSPKLLKKFMGNLGSAIEEAAKQLPDDERAGFAIAEKDSERLGSPRYNTEYLNEIRPKYEPMNEIRPKYENLPADHPCARQTNGPVPDPEDCSSYFLCSNGIPYRMKCASGTVWSVDVNTCTFDYDVDYPCVYRSGGGREANSRDFVAYYTDNLVEPVDEGPVYQKPVAKELPKEEAVDMETVHVPKMHNMAHLMMKKTK